MAKQVAVQQVRLRIGCVNALTDDALEFGLQDKARNVYAGVEQSDGTLRFQCEVTAKRNDDGTPGFSGSFVHGTPADHFLYLTWKHITDGQIRQRIKIKLGSITWAQVERALEGGVLEASIDGTRTGSVPLLGEGWQVAPP